MSMFRLFKIEYYWMIIKTQQTIVNRLSDLETPLYDVLALLDQLFSEFLYGQSTFPKITGTTGGIVIGKLILSFLYAFHFQGFLIVVSPFR